MAWGQIAVLLVSICLLAPICMVAIVAPPLLHHPGMVSLVLRLGAFIGLLLLPSTLVVLYLDRGAFGWLRALWALGSLALATFFLWLDQSVVVALGIVWPGLLFLLSRLETRHRSRRARDRSPPAHR